MPTVIAAIRNWSASAAVSPGGVRPALEIALALLLVVQVARVVWALVAPSPELAARPASVSVAPAADLSIFQRFDAFFRTGGQSSTAAETGADSSQMRLYGVRAGGAGGGSAIIGLADGRQVSVGVGEEVEPGLTLESVGPDHVILSRGGSTTRLGFTEIPAGVAAPPPPPSTPQVVTPQAPATATAPAPPQIDPQRLMAQASLRPRMRGLSVDGFVVGARGDGAVLRQAGLQSGDVILAVNGTALNSLEAINGLRSQLTDASTAEIRIERGGQVQTVTIGTRP
jgi:general secretion pathway protein C